jgi:L-lysine exporter family protein LysE/ArgO
VCIFILTKGGISIMTAFFSGFGTGAGLIIAIGAQNAYLLTLGVRKNHHIAAALICAFFDVLLIMIGVTGVGAALASSETLSLYAAWGGAVFLFWYGLSSLKSAFNSNIMEVMDKKNDTLKKVVLTTMAVTLLNPHVYIDTVLLVGSISTKFGSDRIVFGIGACLASVSWFAVLTFLGTALSKYFARPMTWRVLDFSVCMIMWGVGASLVI